MRYPGPPPPNRELAEGVATKNEGHIRFRSFRPRETKETNCNEMAIHIPPLDPAWFQRAAEHQARLTMPTGALGRLLDLGQQLCAIQESLQPRTEPAAVLVMAADHGIAEEGVSAYPQEVTGQMVLNFLRGGAAINVLARRQNLRVLVANMGIKSCSSLPLPADRIDWIADTALGPGTANFLKGPA